MKSSARHVHAWAMMAALGLAATGCTIGSPIGPRVAAPVSAPDGPVRFVVLGDAGTGDAEQYAVARLMKRVCAGRCSFVLYVGDTAYPSGFGAPEDERWYSLFEHPYAALHMPFFVALGNHDYGWGGVAPPSIADDKARDAVAYSARSERWRLPAPYYTFRLQEEQDRNLAQFVAIDSPRIAWHTDAEQQRWVARELSTGSYRWRIAFGHHPYVSAGPHGSAGQWSADLLSGSAFKKFVEERLCGHVDVYFSGHEHNLQWPHERCGTQFLISGAGGRAAEPVSDGDAYYVSRDGGAGALLVELDADKLVGTFFTTSGERFSKVIEKSPGEQEPRAANTSL